jgi:arsenite-transporting ATPase
LACAAGVAYAKAGRRVLVVSIDQAPSVADVLGVGVTAADEVGVHPVAPGLDVAQIDSLALLESRFRDFAAALPAASHAHAPVALGALDPAELTGLPGVQELLTLNEVRRLTEQSTWDTVIVDCGPTAELIRTVTAPETALTYLDRLWPREQRIIALQGRDPRMAVLAAVVEQVADAMDAVRALLSDPSRCAVLAVATPERVALAETARLRSALTLYGLAPRAVLVNKTTKRQAAMVAEFAKAFPELTVREVPCAENEPIGVAALGALGTTVAAASDALGDARVRPQVRLESGDGGVDSVYLLRMPLPAADPAGLRLGRVGDDLLVTVDGVRRRIALASVLRRCAVLDAELDGDDLLVRFSPDPEVWPA